MTSSQDSPSVDLHEASFAGNQRLIWVGQQLCPDDPIYEVPYRYTICGPIDPIRFCKAFRELIKQTEVLRVVASDANWKKPLVRGVLEIECRFEDLASETDPIKAADQIVADRLARSFRRTESLCDAMLIRVAPDHWQFYLTLHHALTDAFGGRALLAHLAGFYAAELSDGVPPGTHDYQAFVKLQSGQADDESYGRHREWWNARSETAPGTRFYSGSVVPGTTRQTRVVEPLSDQENTAIATLVKTSPFRQITPALSHFNLFATALTAWLHRLQQRDSLCVGATTHGRSTEELRETIGLFMQLLPFGVTMGAGETFASLSTKIARETMGFLAHAQPGVMTTQSQRAFDVALNIIDLSVDDFCGMPASMQWLHNGYGDPERRLTISGHARPGDQWELLFDFGDSSFGASQRDRAISHFKQTLMAIAESVEKPVAEYDLLTQSDRAVLSRHSGGAMQRARASETRPVDLWEVFSQVCQRSSDSVAICGPQKEVTYRDLFHEAQDVARQIETLGCGELVPLLCRRDENAVIAMSAVLASRRCFLIIDADNPDQRTGQLLKQSGACVMIDARGPGIAVLEVQTEVEAACDLAKDACYVLFTSGSTGRPNGVVVGHDSIWNLLQALEELAPCRQQARCAWWTNVGFDVAMYEVFSALLFGRTLCICSDAERLDAGKMIDWMRRERIESAYLPPFFLDATDRFLSDGSLDLKRLLVGVEPIPQRLLASIASQLPELALINGYGPTETTVCATLHRIHPDDQSPGPASIGRPVPGNVIKIVDGVGQEVPPGVRGELWIGGVGLAKGYLSNPELTRERFVQDHAADDRRVWYRSGDQVCLRDDGTLQFFGRIDDQLKLSGVRIEPGEIAAAIRECDGVDDCFVLPQVHDGQVERLIALIEADAGVDTDRIRRQLRLRLMPAMVPSRFLVRDRLPRNENGKVDRASLLRLIAERRIAELEPSFRPEIPQPRNPVEYALTGITRDVLGQQAVTIEDDFFQLGGSSLDAMNVVSKAAELGIEIQIQDVFQTPTVAGLAETIRTRSPDDARGTKESTMGPNGEFVQAVPPEELSDGQRSIWYYSQTHPDSAAYHFQIRWQSNGRLDSRILSQCFTQLSERHPALRTTFESRQGIPAPVTHAQLVPSIQIWDRPVSDQEVIKEGQRPFDLERDSPLRILLVRPPTGGDFLAITAHHIAVDERSVMLMMGQFTELYRDNGGSPPLSRSKRGLTPFLREGVNGWWSERLSGCDRSISLPYDFGRSDLDSDAGELFRFSLSPSLSASARKVASSQGVSLGTFLLASYTVLLSRYSGSENFAIGLPVSLRDDLDADEEIGYLIEALPITCQVSPQATFGSVLRKTQGDLSDLLAHRRTSYQQLAERFGTLFETMFALQQPPATLRLGDDLELTPEVADLGSAKFDLTWFVVESSAEIDCAVEFRTNRFRRDTIRLMTEHWRALLRELTRDPNQTIGEVDFITEVDRQASKALIGPQKDDDGQADYQCVCQWIESKASASPDRIAVRQGDDVISYQDLARLSSGVAAKLRRNGVGIETPVALCLSRSIEMVIGMLGIMKSGGVYVPLDPHQPGPRLQRIAANAGARVVVTSGGGFSGLDEIFDHVISLSKEDDTCGSEPPAFDAIDADSLAYILHTSGSTGTPKGVEITRRSLLRSTLARNEFYDAPPECFLMVSPVWFDSSIAALFWTLCGGGTLVVPTDDDLRDTQRIASLIERAGVTSTLMLPSLYQLLLTHADPEQMQSIRSVVVAGETCSKAVVDRHGDVLPKARLFNEYGPTEASVWATACELSSIDDLVSIGRSVNGSPVYLLDHFRKPVPIGAIGEIYIGGNRLARGYRGDPELTGQKFVPDPYADLPARLYRTGDLARLRRDGTLIFLGRSDDQFKVSGGRIEPAEIEAALIEIDGVSDAAVALVETACDRTTPDSVEVVDSLSRLPIDVAQALLDRAEQIGDPVSETIALEDDNVRLRIELKREGFVSTPRPRQRKWLLDQTLRESLADLAHLDRLADQMVPGSDAPHLPRDLSTDQLTPQEIMEDWQTPLMKAMADWATDSHGDVLEVGFGRGVAATMIQENGVRSHTVIEMNPHSINDHFRPWRERHADQDIRLVAGRWQDVLDQLKIYDTVFFHAFPMNEAEFLEYVATSATFAEHFFPVASMLLRQGGTLTYLTTEIDSLSRRHQRSLLEHFSEVQFRVQPLSVPEETKDAWWADSMVVVRAIR